jgi:hypothetical protein
VAAQEVFSDGFDAGDGCGWSVEVDGNDSEGSATQLADTGDCDTSDVVFSNTLHPIGEVDFFTFLVVDEFGCPMEPLLTVNSDVSVEVCAYAECVTGTAVLKCPGTEVEDTSPMGRPGCCAAAPSMQVDLQLDIDCMGTLDDSSDIWVRIEDPLNNCVHYSAQGNP